MENLTHISCKLKLKDVLNPPAVRKLILIYSEAKLSLMVHLFYAINNHISASSQKVSLLKIPQFRTKFEDLNEEQEIEFIMISKTNFEKLERMEKTENKAIEQVYEEVDGFESLRKIFKIIK